jgi:hypothetical protein
MQRGLGLVMAADAETVISLSTPALLVAAGLLALPLTLTMSGPWIRGRRARRGGVGQAQGITSSVARRRGATSLARHSKDGERVGCTDRLVVEVDGHVMGQITPFAASGEGRWLCKARD